jgi:hypothetical protein
MCMSDGLGTPAGCGIAASGLAHLSSDPNRNHQRTTPHWNFPTTHNTFIMAKRIVQGDQIVKLIVGAGQASPSPPVGPALGSKGVKSMDFCKVISPSFLLLLVAAKSRENCTASGPH